MVFNTAHFEQHFDEPTLQKGLGLFRNGKVELLEHPSRSEYRFFCGKHELTLKKTGQRVLGFSCSCGKKSCEHLAASLFYFFPALADKVGEKRTKNLSDPLKKEFDQLVRSVREHAQDFIKTKQPSEFIGYFEGKTTRGSHWFESALAVYSEKWCFESISLGESKTSVESYLNRLADKLGAKWKKGLKAAEKRFWLLATENSLRKNQVLWGDGFYFLGLRALALMREQKQVKTFRQLLEERKYTKKFSQAFDPLVVLRFAADIKGDPKHRLSENFRPEELMALAETLQIKGKLDKALKLLLEKGAAMRQLHPEYLNDYLTYLESLAKAINYKPGLMYVMRERFLHQPYIKDGELDEFISLSGKNASDQLDLLVKELRNARRYFSFQKLSLVLLKAKRYTELVAEIRKEANQFKLLHSVMMKQLPEYDPKHFPLYVKHLLKAIEEARYHQLQVAIFNEARIYIDRLPSEVGSSLLGKLSDQLGHQSFFAKYLQADSAGNKETVAKSKNADLKNNEREKFRA